MRRLNIDPKTFRYEAMLGVGGIGAGSFFALHGGHTLGREESRGGHFLDRQDYCKLHIVSHYVSTLLGSAFATIPLGMVGDDGVGKGLVAEMADAGIDMRYVTISPGDQTLFSFCFVYPDGSGGNMTTDDSACSKVDAAFVNRAEREFASFAGRGIALAVPEVPIAARQALLALGTKHGFFRVASFTSEEIPEAIEAGMLRSIDLLVLNIDEAAVSAGLLSANDYAESIAQSAVKRLIGVNPGILISITAGARGSWCWDGRSLTYVPVFKAEAQNTAGAGDAYLAGIIVGLVAGLDLPHSERLGALVAGMSVTSPHTIDKRIGKRSLREFAAQSGAGVPDGLRAMLED